MSVAMFAALRPRALSRVGSLVRSFTASISSRAHSCTLHTAAGLSFQKAEAAAPRAHKQLGLVLGRSLTLRVSPSAE
jgi:hypothetical protein